MTMNEALAIVMAANDDPEVLRELRAKRKEQPHNLEEALNTVLEANSNHPDELSHHTWSTLTTMLEEQNSELHLRGVIQADGCLVLRLSDNNDKTTWESRAIQMPDRLNEIHVHEIEM